jgi:hypothetical protein
MQNIAGNSSSFPKEDREEKEEKRTEGGVTQTSLNSNTAVQASPSSTSSPCPWILSPSLDYLLCCGGLMWFFALVEAMGFSTTKTDTGSSLLGLCLIWGTVLFNEPHGKATWVRIFGSATTPRSVKVAVVIWAVILIGCSYFSITDLAYTKLFVKITLCWLLQHYIAQTYGVAIIYCVKRNFALSNHERLGLQWFLRSFLIFVVIRMFTDPRFGAINFLGIQVPLYGPLPVLPMLAAQAFFGLMCLLGMYWLGYRYFKKKEFFPLPALTAMLSLCILLNFERTTPFFMLGVTFYHGSQYLAIIYSYFLREQALKDGRTIAGPSLLREYFTGRSIIYYFSIILLGFVTGIFFPQGLVRSGLEETLVIGTLYSAFNCHHFLADALLWRIRNKEVRKLLV